MSLKYGKNDRIHGWNPIYRNAMDGSPFQSFEMEKKGNKQLPGKFLYAMVSIENDPGAKVPDHQGHIVPQNMLGIVINEVGDALTVIAKKEPQNLPKYITDPSTLKEINPKLASINLAWLPIVWKYGTACKGMLTENPEDTEEAEWLIDEVCSIVVWNPVNICRAPEDKNRGGYPKESIDQDVALYLEKHTDSQPMSSTVDVLGTLTVINNTLPRVNDYITACAETLIEQLAHGLGYYKFPWTNLVKLPNFMLTPQGIKPQRED
ncbi:hypothetical protein BKI52_10895 [marine bacterium AO1-C]|nr:hypothetical protein BKI52_10895 [marine bacterium AO1-C]